MPDIIATASEKVSALLASLQEDRESGQTMVGIDWVIARLQEIVPSSEDDKASVAVSL